VGRFSADFFLGPQRNLMIPKKNSKDFGEEPVISANVNKSGTTRV
jgi:hypothetical protein